jgi:TPR repeat protein
LLFTVLCVLSGILPSLASAKLTPTEEAEALFFSKNKALAHKGDPIGQRNLGLCYSNGYGLPRGIDKIIQYHAEAAKWYRKAAEQGLADAQFDLAEIYRFGSPGVAENPEEAYGWYRCAAEQGHPEAQVKLGYCYMNGSGIPKDDVEAVRWFRKSAKQGFELAWRCLGSCYENGEGVAADDVTAYACYTIAGSYEFAPEALARVEKRLSADERVKGARLARDLSKQIVTKGESVNKGK